MKKLLAIVLALSLILAMVTGCTPKEDKAESTEPKVTEAVSGGETQTDSGPEPVTIRIAWWGSQSRHDYTLQLLDMYTELNPHVTFEAEYTGWDDYWQKLSYQATANDLPDIITTVIGRPEPEPLIEAGLFADLNEFVGDELNLDQVSDSLIATGEVDGKLLGAALSSNALAIIYDPEILAAAGVEVPEFGYTWDDFEAMCQKIHDELGIYGTGDIETENILYNYYPRQFGEHFFADDEDGVGVSEEVFADYMAMKLNLQEKGLMPTVAEIAQEMGVEDHPIVHGKAAFAWKWAPNLSTLESAAGKPLGLLPLPGPNAADAQFVKAGMHFSIAESSAVKEEAAKFIDWFINDIEANKIINADRGIPASAEVRAQMIPLLGETQQKVFDFVDFVSENSSPQDSFLPENVNDITEKVSETEELIMFSQLSVEEATLEFFKSLN